VLCSLKKVYRAIKTWRSRNYTFTELVKEVVFQFFAIPVFLIVYVLLTIIEPFKLVRFGFLYASSLGHQALNLDLFLRRRQKGEAPQNCYYIIFVYGSANKQLQKLFSRRFKIIEYRWLGRLLSLFAILDTKYCQHLEMNSNEYHQYQGTICELEFTHQERELGIKKLKELGIQQSDWYVCIFSRDSEHYRKVYGVSDSVMKFRDADINSYIDAVKYIVSLGGYVVRMGMNVSKPFALNHPKVIDYALTHRSDFMDVFLTANCKFYIGTASGGSDMARIFDKHQLAVNWTPIGWAPWGNREIYMPKTICFKSTGSQVPYEEALKVAKDWRVSLDFDISKKIEELDMTLVENTPEQILEATKEMIARIDGKHIETKEYSALLERYFMLRKKHNNWCKNVYTPVAENYLRSLNLN